MEPTASGTPATPVTKPVMDIVPPRGTDPVKAPPPDTAATAQTQAPVETKEKAAKVAVVHKPPKPAGNGTGMAIAATVVVILGLAALMVYAYLRSQGISIF